MWKEGSFVIDGVELFYQAKVFDEPSQFGINNGRVSKLAICPLINGRPAWVMQMIGYDRGWYQEPYGEIDEKALEYVLNLYS